MIKIELVLTLNSVWVIQLLQLCHRHIRIYIIIIIRVYNIMLSMVVHMHVYIYTID